MSAIILPSGYKLRRCPAKSHNGRQDIQVAVCNRYVLPLGSGVRTALLLRPLSGQHFHSVRCPQSVAKYSFDEQRYLQYLKLRYCVNVNYLWCLVHAVLNAYGKDTKTLAGLQDIWFKEGRW